MKPITVDPAAITAWTNVPVDDVDYMSSIPLGDPSKTSDLQLRDLADRMQINRYGGWNGEGSWRNYNGRWRAILLNMWGLKAKFAHVLDYGCGFGLEALQYAREDVLVSLADISRDNLRLANRLLRVFACDGYLGDSFLIGEADLSGYWFDIVHCVGVLHHIPDPTPTMELLSDICGELRLMVYSDEGWRIAMHAAQMSAPPPSSPTLDLISPTPERQQFIRFFDSVGSWADWYDEAKLRDMFGHMFTIEQCEYITRDGRYLAAVLKPRQGLM